MEDNDNKMMNGTRRVTSPPNTSVAPLIARNDLSYNNNNVTMTTTGGPSYEQKYSPSSSSGVATGPSSPSFTSLHQSTSQENLGQDTLSAPGHSPVCPMFSPVAATTLLLAQGRSPLTLAQVETGDLHEEVRLLN